MRRPRTDLAQPWLFVLLFFTFPGVATSQEESEHEAEQLSEIGIFTGFLRNVEAHATGPSAGMDYTRELSPRIGIGAIAEFATAGKREALFAASLVVRPGEAWKVVAAPGVILEQELDSSSRSVLGAIGGRLRRPEAGYGRKALVQRVLRFRQLCPDG